MGRRYAHSANIPLLYSVAEHAHNLCEAVKFANFLCRKMGGNQLETDRAVRICYEYICEFAQFGIVHWQYIVSISQRDVLVLQVLKALFLDDGIYAIAPARCQTVIEIFRLDRREIVFVVVKRSAAESLQIVEPS